MEDNTAHVTPVSYPMHSPYTSLQPQVRCHDVTLFSSYSYPWQTSHVFSVLLALHLLINYIYIYIFPSRRFPSESYFSIIEILL